MDSCFNISLILIVAIITFILIYTFFMRLLKDFLRKDDFKEFALVSVREIYGFTEDDAITYVKKFNYSRLLYNIDGDDRDTTWINDEKLFLKTCFIALSILSFYGDPESIYYMDKKILHQVRFTCRIGCAMLGNKSNKVLQNVHALEAFIMLLHSAYSYLIHEYGDDHVNQYICKHLELFKNIFPIYSEDISMEYYKPLIICKKYLRVLKLIN